MSVCVSPPSPSALVLTNSPHAAQGKVLRYIPPIKPEEVLLGQYVATETQDGKKPAYLDDDTVPGGSICPTFATMVLHINSPRWEGVAFILKAGNYHTLPSQSAWLTPTCEPFSAQRAEDGDPDPVPGRHAGHLQGDHAQRARIRVQPGEAVYLKMNSTAPGLPMRTVPTEMDLTYKHRFSDLKIPKAYECVSLPSFLNQCR